jgi:outer membrane biosynthesis protein TonB
VRFGSGSAALPRQETGEAVLQTTPEASRAATADPEPAVPTVETAPPQAEHLRQPEKPAVVTPRLKPEPSKSRAGPRRDPFAAVKSTDRWTPPPDDLETQLKSLTRQQAQASANQRLQNEAGSSSLTASGNGAAGGGSARYNVKDFIRAQIERHWRLDVGTLGADFVIAIHVTLNRDGSVTSADIIDDPRYRSSAAYHAAALSARNAVLLSSPLELPPGRYDEVANVTLKFVPRNALQ